MSLTPQQIVKELDSHIIGQDDSKKAVAIAIRNRWRRLQLAEEVADEIQPKNILMIGPTGVGKTEISRRIAKIIDAPFIKVEATKFTEVGYVGRDVESIVRQLADEAMRIVKKQEQDRNIDKLDSLVEDKILNYLVPKAQNSTEADNKEAKQLMRKKLREGKLENKDLEITSKPKMQMGVNIMGQGQPNLDEIMGSIEDMMKPMKMSGPGKKVNIPIKKARGLFRNEIAEDLLAQVDLRTQAVNLAESSGIVFIDEIDKIVKAGSTTGDVSREGVQRDLLPIIEGSQVKTKLGYINTGHVLFIASGAFHKCKPADLIPELQGRLPVRVELKDLTAKDFERILREPKSSIIKQYQQLLGVDGVNLKFNDNAISALAKTCYEMNLKIENIGARRLHTLMEKLLEQFSFHIPEQPVDVEITKNMVEKTFVEYLGNGDLSKFIL